MDKIELLNELAFTPFIIGEYKIVIIDINKDIPSVSIAIYVNNQWQKTKTLKGEKLKSFLNLFFP